MEFHLGYATMFLCGREALSVLELTKELQKRGELALEGVAIQGVGVFETLKELAKLVLAELKKGG